MAYIQKSDKSFWITIGVGGVIVLILGGFILSMMRPRLATNMMGFSTSGSSGVAVGAPSMMEGYAQGSKAYDTTSIGIMPIPPVPSPSAGETAATSPAKVIRNGNFAIEVESVRDTTPKVADVAKTEGGYVDASNISEDAQGNVTGYVTVRVPSSKFDATMDSIRALAVRVTSESTSVQDVTEQYTDLEARLSAAQDEEAQYLTILKQATSVTDLLSVQQYLSQVRSTIESLQGQIQYLSNQTDYSTISVTLTEQASLNIPTAKFDPLRDIREAGRTVILLAQAFITFLISFIIIGGAILIPAALIGYVMYRVVKRILARR